MRRQRNQTMRLAAAVFASALVGLVAAAPAHAGCGCDKPPPPKAAVRPFVGWTNQMITLFDSRLVPGQFYSVEFLAADGTSDWSRGKVRSKRDLADGQYRAQLRVSVGAVSLGPCQINVYGMSNGGSTNVTTFLYGLGDDQFTVTASPIALRDIDETVSQGGYQAGVGRDAVLVTEGQARHQLSLARADVLGESGALRHVDPVMRPLVRPAGLAIRRSVVHQHVLDAEPVGFTQKLCTSATDTEDGVALTQCIE